MGTKTKIDWCDASWNPVTGCLHGCEYCYARQPKRQGCARKEWIDEIAEECKRHRKLLFMKDSLRGLMGDDFKQEFPWEVK